MSDVPDLARKCFTEANTIYCDADVGAIVRRELLKEAGHTIAALTAERDEALHIRDVAAEACHKIELVALEYNDLLRSAHSIALRHGADTNWSAFVRCVDDVLTRHHPTVRPLIARTAVDAAGGLDK